MHDTMPAVLSKKATDSLVMLMLLCGEPVSAPPAATALLWMNCTVPEASMLASSTYMAPTQYVCMYL